MTDLRTTRLSENLEKKLNTGLIPLVDPRKHWVVQPVSVNSYFAIGHFHAKGHDLVYQLHFMLQGPIIDYNISITDETTGEYYSEDKVMPVEAAKQEVVGSGAEAKQIIRMPNGCLEGTYDKMHWEGIMENGKVVMDMEAYGYPVYNGGVGLFGSCLKDETFHQYSLPTMKTTGVIELNGEVYEVTGDSWMDRQWQQSSEYFDIQNAKWTWTWMDINLDNGDVISLWDMNNITRDYNYAWGTLMHPDGSQSVIRMKLLLDSTTEYWQSEKSGNCYPVAYELEFPDIQTKLKVESVIKASEIISEVPFLNKYEGSCKVSGVHMGKEAKGHCLLEILGDWRPDTEG